MNLDGLRTALYSALNVSGLTSQLSTAYSPLAAIFNEIAPQVDDSGSPSAFPYVTYRITSDVGYNDKGATGTNAIVQVDVYSRLHTTQAEDIGKIVHGLLHRQALAFTGHITTECESIETMTDADGETRRCMLRFRVVAAA